MTEAINFCEEGKESVTEVVPQPLCAAYECPSKRQPYKNTKVDLACTTKK